MIGDGLKRPLSIGTDYSRMKYPIPLEGGILTLWFCGLAMGLSFPVERAVILASVFYLGGSLLFLVSITTVEGFIRQFRGRREAHPQLLIPPALGLVAWGLVLPYDAVAVFVLFVVALAFVSVQFIRRREREWQTRLGFTAAVLLMALLGPLMSGFGIGAPLALLMFAVPFTFFSAQELLVQRIAEVRRLSSGNAPVPGPRGVQSRLAVLYFFLFAYAILSAASLLFAPSPAFPVVFGLFLVGFFAVWRSSEGAVSFKRLGIEQASLDAMMVVAIVAYALL